MTIVTRLACLLCLVLGPIATPALAGCALMPPAATQSITVPGTGRALRLHMPAHFDATRPAALVFLFHGSGGTAARMLERSGLAATADRHGFILAAPDGGIGMDGGFAWNIPGVPTPSGALPGPDDADDVAYIKATIDWLATNGCIDRTRVYATGFSGGGRMASLLGCVAADRFAAIAPVAGLRAGIPSTANPAQPDPASCRPSAPMPVITFAGDTDSENPIEGGGSPYWQYPMRAAEARWAALNGCAPTPVRHRISAHYYEERFTHCRQGADIVARVTVGGTHIWLADNAMMWAFLSRHRRKL
jgi:polyhydroxybutyrate depolymerase